MKDVCVCVCVECLFRKKIYFYQKGKMGYKATGHWTMKSFIITKYCLPDICRVCVHGE